jgi:hypothetical protein
MALTHSSAVRTGLADYVANAVNNGSTNPSGRLVFLTSANATVASLNFSNPAFGGGANGVVSANAIQDDTNAVGGTVTKFEIRDRNATVILSGTVTATGGGGDIELSSTTVGAGDTISVSSLTYEASA